MRSFQTVTAAAEALHREKQIGLSEAILVTNLSRNPHGYCRDAVQQWLKEHGVRIMSQQVRQGGVDGLAN